MRHLSMMLAEPRALDVFAYRGLLFILAFDGRVLSYDINRIAEKLDEGHGGIGRATAYALFSSKGIGATDAQRASWRTFDHETSHTLNVEMRPDWESNWTVEGSAHLDWHVYYNKMFFATDQGSYVTPLENDGLLPSERDPVQRLGRSRTDSLSVGMGAVGASLGDEGLAVFLDVASPGKWRQERVDSRSLRSSIGSGQAVNYPTHGSYEVLETGHTLDKSGRKILSRVKRVEENGGRRRVAPDAEYVVWESGRLLEVDNQLVSTLGRGKPTSRHRVLADLDTPSSILSISVSGNRCIVSETSRQLMVSRGNGNMILHVGGAASVRTFPGSQRYRRLIAATVEGGLLLSAAFASDEDFG